MLQLVSNRLLLHPRRSLMIVMGIFTLFFLFYILFGQLTAPKSVLKPWETRELARLCSSTGASRIDANEFDRLYPLASNDTWVEEEEDVHWDGDDEDLIWVYEKFSKMIDTDRLLLGPPTPHFKDNLRPELRYITGWYEAGFTNQFISISHLLFIAKITPHHIPVVPPFIARPHLPQRAGMKDVSAVFDLGRWARSIDKGLVEWKDVKDLSMKKGLKADDQIPQADEVDEMGCWSTWATGNFKDGWPNTVSRLPEYLNLDISYTPIPYDARLKPHDEEDVHVTFNSLSVLVHATSDRPNPLSDEVLKPPTLNPSHKNAHPPGTHLTCYDFLYWISSSHAFEWEQEFSSAWNVVGKYARWSDHVRALARTTLALTLGIKKRDVMWPGPGDRDWHTHKDGRKFHPHDLKAMDERDKVHVKFISINARRGDLIHDCPRRKEKGLACYPPLSVFENLIMEIEEELRQKGKMGRDEGGLPVIMTSDETDEGWWSEVEAMGWKRVIFPDELAVPPGIVLRNADMVIDLGKEIYEKLWSRMLIEMAIQSFGTGFIGTQSSTMSVVAMRRVQDWQDGVARMANVWG